MSEPKRKTLLHPKQSPFLKKKANSDKQIQRSGRYRAFLLSLQFAHKSIYLHPLAKKTSGCEISPHLIICKLHFHNNDSAFSAFILSSFRIIHLLRTRSIFTIHSYVFRYHEGRRRLKDSMPLKEV